MPRLRYDLIFQSLGDILIIFLAYIFVLCFHSGILHSLHYKQTHTHRHHSPGHSSFVILTFRHDSYWHMIFSICCYDNQHHCNTFRCRCYFSSLVDAPCYCCLLHYCYPFLYSHFACFHVIELHE